MTCSLSVHANDLEQVSVPALQTNDGVCGEGGDDMSVVIRKSAKTALASAVGRMIKGLDVSA